MRIRVMIKGVPLFSFLRGMPTYLKHYRSIRRQAASSKENFPFGKLYPCVEDRYKACGELAEHYFYQDLVVANRIFLNHPIRHVDVGSRIDGFVAHVAAFRELEVFDLRDVQCSHPNIVFQRADIMDEKFPLKNYCDSVSCLHAFEHFGLGRYGDAVDFEGHLRAWRNLYGMLKEKGKLYFSVPIGPQRIEFDAHRVFSLPYLLNLIEGKYRIDYFSYIDDENRLVMNPALEEPNIADNFSCRYGCGIFELSKI